MAIAYDKAQRQIIRFMSGAENIGRSANRSSIDRQPVHGSSEASKQQPQINKQARRETLLSLDDFTQCHTSTWQVATVQLGNAATWQHSQLSNWQRGKWQVEMWRSSGDVPLRVALVIRQQVAKKRLAASSNVPRWQPTNEASQAPLMMSPTHRLGVKIVAAFGQLIATRHWANKLIRGKSSVQAQQGDTTRDNERQRDSLTL